MTVSADLEVDTLLLGFRSSAYLCVFVSLVITTNPQLHTAQTNEHDGLTSSVSELLKKKKKKESQAEGLRALDIAFICKNLGDYQDLEIGTVNADSLNWMTYSSIEDHIAAVAVPSSMPAELELVASRKALAHPTFALNTDNKVM